ncbi:unnamed protein product [Mytilus edulis]|uniref:Uncharacterized protein n=1 Tax=Mytilus edulis TaxID=6550 RepID=A0A8S3SPH3_MYTED|nr:unnamed protein product [Mytilus edulis]
MCRKSICLEWRVTENKLMLICQIHDVHLLVLIADPNGNILADCLPSFHSNCDAYYKNGTMSYITSTKEVIFTVHGTINNKVNGNWTCRHGAKGDRAVAFVSVKNSNGTYKYPVPTTTVNLKSKYISTDTEIYKGLEASTMTGISAEGNSRTSSTFITESSTDNANAEYGQRSTQNNVNKKTGSKTGLSRSEIYVPLAGGLVLFLSLFVGFNIWVSRKCRNVNLKIEEEFLGANTPSSAPISNTGTNYPQIENNVSVYETINENEMIQDLVDLSMLNKTEAISVSSCSRTSESSTASNRSYLDVVDYNFISNPYEALQCHRDSDTVHLYSTTVKKMECKLESSSIEVATCLSYKLPPEIKQKVMTTVPNHQSLSLLHTNANESVANDAGLKSNTKECGDQNTPASLLNMECLMVPDIPKTTNAHSVSPSTSNRDNSNSFIELPRSTNQRNVMSTLL